MRRILLFAFAALVFGCNVNDSDKAKTVSISPGVYQVTLNYTGANAGLSEVREAKYNADGTFRGRVFAKDGTSSCAIVEVTGTWIAKGSDKIMYTFASAMARKSCGDQMESAPGLPPPDSSTVRNVKPGSFEEYLEEDNLPASWILWEKI